MTSQNRASIVLDLRQKWAEESAKGRALTDIHRDMVARGSNASLTSVRRVLVDGDVNSKFDYDELIAPLVQILITDKSDESFSPDKAREYYNDRSTLRRVIAEKNIEIEEQQIQIEEMQKEIEHLTSVLTAKNDSMTSIITFMQEQLTTSRVSNMALLEMLREANATVRELSSRIGERGVGTNNNKE